MRRTIAIGLKPEAVGELSVPWCVWTKPLPFEISLLDIEAPLFFFFLLRSRKPKHEAHDDCSSLKFLRGLLPGRKSYPFLKFGDLK